ncbi:MAG: hypothetical protein HOO96_10195 [Polyangiaceae bacterium]|nr:hypothetical protein [Polyangiaceae bacterium]
MHLVLARPEGAAPGTKDDDADLNRDFPYHCEATVRGGAALLEDQYGLRQPVHLEGWGRGRFAHSLFHPAEPRQRIGASDELPVRCAGAGEVTITRFVATHWDAACHAPYWRSVKRRFGTDSTQRQLNP